MNEKLSPNPTLNDCNGKIHPMAVKGLELFNVGQYWKAHEALEQAWLEEPGEVRHLYRGILQVGVTYLHVERRNYYGALKVYHRSRRWLAPFPDVCRGINIGVLKQDVEDVIAEVRRLGPDQLDKFDRSLLKPVYYEINKIG
jgi:predicted metal-dependent hydrolase